MGGLLLLLWCLAWVSATPTTWEVEDCILATMAGHVEVRPDLEDPNTVLTVRLPKKATARGDCYVEVYNKPEITDQILSLAWVEETPHGVGLIRNFTLLFSINITSQLYGVSLVSAVYETKHDYYIENIVRDNETVSRPIHMREFISMTTFRMDTWEFQVPVGRSYFCGDAGKIPLHTVLHRSTDPSGDPGIRLKNAVITVLDVHIDAFRLWTVPPGKFQTPVDCEFKKRDIIPIVVGVSLFAMVLSILIAYFIYKREKEEEQDGLIGNEVKEEEEVEDQDQEQEQPQDQEVEPILTEVEPILTQMEPILTQMEQILTEVEPILAEVEPETVGEADSKDVPVTEL